MRLELIPQRAKLPLLVLRQPGGLDELLNRGLATELHGQLALVLQRAHRAVAGVEVEAETIAYSAGGIWPCIVGTALLCFGIFRLVSIGDV